MVRVTSKKMGTNYVSWLRDQYFSYDAAIQEQNLGLGGDIEAITGDDPRHFAVTTGIGLAAGSLPVSVGVGIAHVGYHLLSEYLDSGSSSQSYQQNGGPGTKSNYKPSRNSRTDGARSVIRTGGRRSGSKPRKKCPNGYVWSKKLQSCVRWDKEGLDLAFHQYRERKR